ncbi:pyocin knob domain-containing protein [Halobacillus litoralis]|uniref:Uncharacterized protein n=1 Tax=Halobacillus litoralis TaxID=45668 RepID=A0A410MDM4_9BACI|nr:pyocin knob domain-containing protein [Halobacillus litoralis]QAS52797.1 hypothetical protein HLI_11620 [Halobacillus litoralis]
MPITTTLPDWGAAGVQPPESLRTNGWQEAQKPAAEYFNWFFSTSYFALKDLSEQAASQQDLDNHKSDQTNPHQVTKSQVGLSNVDNVQQASKADFDSHNQDQQNPHEVTAAQVGASPTGHGHSTATTSVSGFMSGNDKTKLNAIPPAANVETKDGAQDKADAVQDWAKSFGLGTSAVTLSDDLNTVTKTGFYYAGNDATNKPLSANGHLIHQQVNNSYRVQYYFIASTSNKGLFYRDCYSGTWNDWQKIETTDGAQGKADKAEQAAIDASMNKETKDVPDKDYNQAITPGWYKGAGDNALNPPPGFLEYGVLLVQERSGNIFQLAIRREEMASRYFTDAEWSEWHMFETTTGAQAKADERVKKTGDKMVGRLDVPEIALGELDRIFNDSNVLPGSLGFMRYMQDGTTSDYATYLSFNAKYDKGTHDWTFERDGVKAYVVKIGHHNGFELMSSTNSPVTAGESIVWIKDRVETTAGAQAKADATQVFKLTQDDGAAKGYYDGDLNNLTENGWHAYTNAASNKPDGEHGIINVVVRATSSYIMQMITSSNNVCYHRRSADGGASWSTWSSVQEKVDKHEQKEDFHVQYLGYKVINESTPPGDFPHGISHALSNDADNGFTGMGSTFVGIVTYRMYPSSPAAHQYAYQYDASEGAVFKRLGDRDANTWGPWVKVESQNVDVDDLKQSVSNGKQQVRDAVIGKGGSVADADSNGVPTFQELADGVNGITTGAIKSIQRGMVGMPSVTSLQGASVSAVDTSKSIIRITGIAIDGYWGPDTHLIRARFITDSNTGLQFIRDGSGEGARISYEVIEFENEVNVQSGSFTMSSDVSPFDISIGSIDPAKAMLFFSHDSVSGAATTHYNLIRGIITDSTTVTFETYTPGATSIGLTVNWFVVELP